MSNLKKRSIAAGLAAAATAAIVIGSALPASAASLYVGGDVNCGATWVNYTNERKTTAWGPTDLYLSNAAGSTYGGWGTTVGVKITATGALHSANYPNGADAWGTLIPSGTYAPTTRFTMRAKMNQTSVGTCDNVWGGTLNY